MNFIVKDEAEHQGEGVLHFYFEDNKWVEKWKKNLDACKMSMENNIQELEPIRNQVLEGKLSPLAYHIEVRIFNVGLLSSYTGIPKRHIKKHLKPENFNQLDDEKLKKYATALGISVEELKKV